MITALFGATGRVGSIVADQLGQRAKLLVRSSTGNGLEITGNVLNQKDIDSVLEGCDAVISTLNTDKADVLSRSMPLILNGMRRHGIKRIITCGTAGILDASHSNGLYRFQSDESKRRSTTAAEDHLSAYLMLKASEMEWTIVCPTYLPDGERTGVFRTSEQVLPEGGRSISTHDTADYILKVLDESLSMFKRDGHIHTPFCPHGSKDAMEEYVEKLITLGYTHATFTEHAPLPRDFIDPAPEMDSAMHVGQMEDYLNEIDRLKRKYGDRIVIFAGLEVDYIEGYEAGTKELLEKYGPSLDDCILSVHFLKKDGVWYCLDYSEEIFGRMTGAYGGVDAVHEEYYRAVLSSIHSDLGPYKPKRIGHMTLANKFQKLYPTTRSFSKDISGILQAILTNGMELDYNGAGIIKPHCGESYPPEPVIRQAYGMGIPIVYGSDAHTVSGLDQGRSRMTFL